MKTLSGIAVAYNNHPIYMYLLRHLFAILAQKFDLIKTYKMNFDSHLCWFKPFNYNT